MPSVNSDHHAEQHWEIAALWSHQAKKPRARAMYPIQIPIPCWTTLRNYCSTLVLPKYPILNDVFFYVSFAQRLAYGKILKTFFCIANLRRDNSEKKLNVVQHGDLLFLTETYTRIWGLMPNIQRAGALVENWPKNRIKGRFCEHNTRICQIFSRIFAKCDQSTFIMIQRDFVVFVSRSPWIAIVQIVTKSHVPKNIAARILC